MLFKFSRRWDSAWIYPAGALLVFCMGYLLFFGHLASVSGSWKYVMRTADDSFYWAAAQASAQVPPSDANPYYFEDIGKRSGIPNLVSMVLGPLSRWLGVPVLFFFPVWHIGLPLLLWGVLFLLLYRLWKYPLPTSAFFSMLALAMALNVRGLAFESLFRFSRPGSSLWMIFLVFSFIFFARTIRRKIFWTVAVAGGLGLPWMNPFLVVPLLTSAVGEFVWQGCLERDRAVRRRVGGMLFLLLVGLAIYGTGIHLSLSEQQEGLKILKSNPAFSYRHPEWSSLVLWGFLLTFVILFHRRFQSPLSVLDRAVLFLFSAQALCGNLQVFWPESIQFGYHSYHFTAELAYHRYSYFLLEFLCLAGWCIEKMPYWLQKTKDRVRAWGIPTVFALWGAVVLVHPDMTPWRLAPNANWKWLDSLPHPALFLGLMPFLTLTTWAYFRWKDRLSFLKKRWVAVLILLLLLFPAYRVLAQRAYDPRIHDYRFENFPFAGAYDWLNQHAETDAVVLTIPPTRLDIDYLVHYTDCKTFIHPFGDRLAARYRDNKNDYRFEFYYHLLLDNFAGFVYKDVDTIPEKLRYVRLDYILAEIPNPYMEAVLKKLEGYVEPVYRDARSVLLRVQV
ncbi:MAG: hypothetical protein ACOY3K_06050 [Candidatus Omnitrophota bacterium]